MPGRLLLYTSAILDLFGEVEPVRRLLASSEQTFVPVVAIGELLYGSRSSRRVDANVARVEELALASTILPCDLETARCYSRIKAALRARGRLFPDNDIWVAAIADRYALTLAARDAHFHEIEGLALAEW